jgi:Tol biopolymer transport system component
MKTQQWREAWTLYRQMRTIRSDERLAFLSQHCSDPEILIRLQAIAQDPDHDPPEPPPWPRTGTLLRHYEITDQLGRGGMGEVYAATDTILRRPVAIKILPARVREMPRAVERFINEARASSALNHPFIVTIYEFIEEPDTLAIVMEMISGLTLREAFADPIPTDRVVELACQVAEALAAAHARGITHRDIKPENIMLRPDGYIKVVDFGLAELAEAVPEHATPSRAAIGGTLPYMSPEQADCQQLSPATDIYSLGVVMAELVLGEHPFRRFEQVKDLQEKLPSAIAPLVGRMLSTQATLRPTAGDVAGELRKLQVELRGPPQPPNLSKRRLYALGSVFVLGFALYLIRLALRPSGDQSSVPEPFTSLPGREDTPSFSPDGQNVAFSWTGPKGENTDIYYKPLSGGALVRLTRGQERDFNPVWAPDGRSLAYRQEAAGGNVALRIVQIDGTGDRKVADKGPFAMPCTTGLAWSRDGRFLVASDVENGLAALVRVSISDGRRNRITRVSEDQLLDCGPSVSPDNRLLAFARWSRYEVSDLYVQELLPGLQPRGPPRRLTTGNKRVVSAAWTPDGRRILFSAGFDDSSLWEIKCCTQAEPRLISVAGEADHPAISPQGVLVFRRQSLNIAIGHLELRADGTSDGVASQVLGSTRADSSPEFSPDGKRIAFESNRSGHHEIWTADPDGANAVQLTELKGPRTGRPNWSPDGKQIAFHSNLGGEYHLFIIASDGGVWRRLTSAPELMQAPRWSPDGVWIYFQCRRGGTDRLCRLPATGGAIETIGPADGHVYEPYPATSRLYFAQGAGSVRKLCSLSLISPGPTACFDLPMHYSVFAVSSHGCYLVVHANREQWQIHFIPFDGTSSTIISTQPYAIGSLAVSRDGRHLLLSFLREWAMDLFRLQLTQ